MADENEIGKIATILIGAYVAGSVPAVKRVLHRLPVSKVVLTAAFAALGFVVTRFGENWGSFTAYLADFLYGMAAGTLADPETPEAPAEVAGAMSEASAWGTITSIPLSEGAELTY